MLAFYSNLYMYNSEDVLYFDIIYSIGMTVYNYDGGINFPCSWTCPTVYTGATSVLHVNNKLIDIYIYNIYICNDIFIWQTTYADATDTQDTSSTAAISGTEGTISTAGIQATAGTAGT